MGRLCGCLSLEQSPSFPAPTPVALTMAWAGCCHYAQLWTDGWHRAGQYVRPDGVLQEIWRFALWHTQFRFSKCSKDMRCELCKIQCEYPVNVVYSNHFNNLVFINYTKCWILILQLYRSWKSAHSFVFIIFALLFIKLYMCSCYVQSIIFSRKF